MVWTPPRRAISTATTITVNSNALPSWLPAAGSWSGTIASGTAVSTNTAESIKGDFTFFTASRDWSTTSNGLWMDYSGAVWNRYIGSYGGMIFHGGGHATSVGMLDNGAYLWNANTRQWQRMTDPGPYPGGVTVNDWSIPKSRPWDSDLLNTYSEVQTNVPCANHSRWLPCVIPPGFNGAGAYGQFAVPYQSSPQASADIGNPQGHALDCYAALNQSSSTAYTSWSRLGPLATSYMYRQWSACVDTSRGYVYTGGDASSYYFSRLNLNTNAWSNASPSGFLSNGFASSMPMVYAPEHDAIFMFNTSWTVRTIRADATPLTFLDATPSGTAPSGATVSEGSGAAGMTWCPDLGSYGALVVYNHTNHEVKACYAPQFPKSGGTWTWATLSSSNTPTGRGNAIFWYNRFQYAPALKSFFLCTTSTDPYGGIVCFRPSEIP